MARKRKYVLSSDSDDEIEETPKTKPAKKETPKNETAYVTRRLINKLKNDHPVDKSVAECSPAEKCSKAAKAVPVLDSIIISEEEDTTLPHSESDQSDTEIDETPSRPVKRNRPVMKTKKRFQLSSDSEESENESVQVKNLEKKAEREPSPISRRRTRSNSGKKPKQPDLELYRSDISIKDPVVQLERVKTPEKENNPGGSVINEQEKSSDLNVETDIHDSGIPESTGDVSKTSINDSFLQKTPKFDEVKKSNFKTLGLVRTPNRQKPLVRTVPKIEILEPEVKSKKKPEAPKTPQTPKMAKWRAPRMDNNRTPSSGPLKSNKGTPTFRPGFGLTRNSKSPHIVKFDRSAKHL